MRHPTPDPNRVQRGIDLDEDLLAGLIHAEAEFWRELFREASVVIGSNEDAAVSGKLAPTTSLRSKYERAIREFNGRQYAQIQKLEEIFDFQPAN